MLSRVAERIYWLGRYLERAENTARLLNVYSTLLLDLPRGSKIGWQTLVEIAGCKEEYDEKHKSTDERDVIRFLLADSKKSASILNSLEMARENARTTREIIPAEAWEQINNLYLFTRDNASNGIARGPRHALLKDIISQCQQITGLLEGAMSHNSGYNFIRIARSLERADMTTRIVDVGSVILLPELADRSRAEEIPEPYENTIWMSVLRSLSADQMYRQHVQDRVNGEDVVTFLLQDAYFPRSVAHCLTKLENCLQALPGNKAALKEVAETKAHILDADIEVLVVEGLLEYIDELQINFADIHTCIAKAWFLPVVKNQD
jgi:uncharacterized alpha-E superfamily protein